VGGLGDVVTSLSRAVQELGHTVEIVLPKYGFLSSSPLLNNLEWDCKFQWGGCEHNVYTQIVEDVRVFFIDSQVRVITHVITPSPHHTHIRALHRPLSSARPPRSSSQTARG
jgi:glycogen synthase